MFCTLAITLHGHPKNCHAKAWIDIPGPPILDLKAQGLRAIDPAVVVIIRRDESFSVFDCVELLASEACEKVR
jgi:hypothetical protein